MNSLVLEEVENGEIAIDVYQKLAADRVLFIHEDLSDRVATDICASLMLKDTENSEEKISIFINTEGGDVRNAFMIYDVIRLLNSPVETICVGSAWIETLLILSAGTPGMRYATANSVICGGHIVHDRVMFSDMTDVKMIKDLVAFDNKKFIEAIAQNVGKKYKEVYSDFAVKKFMTPTQAKRYGLIDGIIKSKK